MDQLSVNSQFCSNAHISSKKSMFFSLIDENVPRTELFQIYANRLSKVGHQGLLLK